MLNYRIVLSWFKIGLREGLFWKEKSTFILHKRQQISLLNERMQASKYGVSFV
jgi:hypothetical protein